MKRNIAGEESDSNKEKKCVYLGCKSTNKEKMHVYRMRQQCKEKMRVLGCKSNKNIKYMFFFKGIFTWIFSTASMCVFSSCFLFNIHFVQKISHGANLHFERSQKRLKSMVSHACLMPRPRHFHFLKS